MAFHGKTGFSFRCLTHGAAALGLLVVSACDTGPQDEGPVFYPPLPEVPRLQFLKTINTAKDIGGSSSGISLFGRAEGPDEMARPYEVAHTKGKIYIADANLGAVVVLNLAEKKFEYIQETEGGPFREPMNIAIGEDGYKYVSDSGRQQVVVLDENDKFVRTYGAKGQFRPLAVVVDGDRVYVCDVQDNEIEVLDRESGEVIGKIGEPGPDVGQFHWPTRMVMDSEKNLYVTDFLKFMIQKFDSTGKFVKAYGELGNFPGATPRPKGIAVDRDGYLYIVDAAFELVQIFDTRTGDAMMGFGKFGKKAGGNWLPSGIDIDYDNVEYFSKYADKNFRPKYLVYVTNQAGFRKVNVYAFGEWIGPLPKGALKPAEAGS